MRILLYPFSIIYGVIVFIRNSFYTWSVFSKTSFPIPMIGIGNLRVGGTGKTPMTEMILKSVSPKNRTAVLSRGYGRKTNGYLLATNASSSEDIGDEPRQMMMKFPKISFAVDGNRVRGVRNLIESIPELELIVLDDVFQHRAITPGLMVLLTAYGDLYVNDYVMPAGMLREQRANASNADIIVVTKCPNEIGVFEQRSIIERLSPKPHQKVFFASEKYGNPISISESKLQFKDALSVILVTGIASADRFKDWLSKNKEIKEHLDFADHYWYSEKDMENMKKLQQKHGSVLVTTEKDAQRLTTLLQNERFANLPVCYIPIEMEIIEDGRNQFNQAIDEFIRSY
jgi:tetraacyldisaccharide 4'-kinase